MTEPPAPPLDNPATDPLHPWLGKIVVLDTQGPLLYVGTLSAASTHHLVLVDADVHHATDSRTTKDHYLVESRDLGVHANRACVVVERRHVASISLLESVRN